MHSTALKRPRCLRLHPILRAADTVVSMQPNRRQKRRPLWRLPDPGPLPRCWISRRTQWSRSSSLSRSMLLYDVNLKDQRLNWPDAAVPTMTEPLFATRYGQPSTQRESGPVGVHTSASFFFSRGGPTAIGCSSAPAAPEAATKNASSSCSSSYSSSALRSFGSSSRRARNSSCASSSSRQSKRRTSHGRVDRPRICNPPAAICATAASLGWPATSTRYLFFTPLCKTCAPCPCTLPTTPATTRPS